MSQILKQSTAFTFRFGPFVDSADGNTQENALTIAAADVLLSKAGGALTAKTDATALTGTGANGHYTCVLDATDTGTLGALRVWSHISGALAVWQDFIVLPANVYDSIVAGTDLLDINCAQLLGTAFATPTVAGVPEVDLTHVAGATTNVAALATNVDAILADTGTDGVVVAAASKTGYRLSATGVDDIWDEATAGHATAGTTGKAVADAALAGDPWNTALPGAYAVGTAGYIVGNSSGALKLGQFLALK